MTREWFEKMGQEHKVKNLLLLVLNQEQEKIIWLLNLKMGVSMLLL